MFDLVYIPADNLSNPQLFESCRRCEKFRRTTFTISDYYEICFEFHWSWHGMTDDLPKYCRPITLSLFAFSTVFSMSR